VNFNPLSTILINFYPLYIHKKSTCLNLLQSTPTKKYPPEITSTNLNQLYLFTSSYIFKWKEHAISLQENPSLSKTIER